MRMKRFAKSIALFLVMALMLVMTVVAADVATNASVYYDSSTQNVRIKAVHPGGAGKTVTVIVTNDNTGTPVYWNDAVADENGAVEFNFKMNPLTNATGVHSVDIGGTGLAKLDVATTYTFIASAESAAFIAEVNPKTDAELKTYIVGDGVTPGAGEANGINCGEGSDYANLPETTQNAIFTKLADTDYNDVYEFITRYNILVSIQALNEGLASDVVANYADIFGLDVSPEGKYAIIEGEDQLEAIENALIAQGFGDEDAAAVKDAFDEAVALALYNDMSGVTMENLMDYIDYTNTKGYTTISSGWIDRFEDLNSSGKKSVMNEMRKESYADFDAVEDQFKDAVEAAEEAAEEAEDKHSGGSIGGGPVTGTIVVTPVAPVTPVEPEVDMFDDIESVEWAKEAINALAKENIINGVADKTFAPNDVLTREQIVKILVGALDLKAEGTVNFTDVAAGEWYAEYIAIAYNSGIVNGTTETEFGVGQALTREQLCTMIYRAIKAQGIELKMVNAPAAFGDNALISDYAKEAVDYLYRAGIINGVGGGNFAPQAETTRAMGAKIIYGVLEGGVK